MPAKANKSGQASLTNSFRIGKKETANQQYQSLKSAVSTTDTKDSVPVGSFGELKPIAPSSGRTKLDISDPKYQKALNDYRTNEISGIIHDEDTDTVEKLLKQFDFVSEYGPTAGLSRLDRWKRAQRLGKNPPSIIKEILETEEGFNDPKYSQSYLYQHV